MSALCMVTAVLATIDTSVILGIVLAAVVLVMLVTMLRRYKRCPANRIMVIYGRTGKGVAKCVHGGASFVWPIFQSYDWLDLEPFVVPIELRNALSQENIRVSVPTTVTSAISTAPGIMQNAAVRLLGQSQADIRKQAEDIILGQMRAVIATMKIDEINRDRQAFMVKVNDAVSSELEKIGLTLINVNIKDIEDESDYIKALGRKAAAEAVNKALVDVAEQEKFGKSGVAEREKDRRTAVAAANSEAEIGEAKAEMNKRKSVANLDAEAVDTETKAESKKASYRAHQRVAEEEAREKGESAKVSADGAIRVAQEKAEKAAEEARASREESRLRAEIVVPAEADKERAIISAEAEREKQIRIAKGEAEATIQRMKAEAEGTQAILDAKASGYKALVGACEGDPSLVAALLLVEKFEEISRIQAKAIQDLPIEKVMVWDGGGESGGVKDLGKRLMGALPPMHELARMAGLELPEYLGKAVKDDDLPKDNEAVAKAREALRNKIEQALDKQEGEQDTDSKPSDES